MNNGGMYDSKTLYVGNLDHQVTFRLLCSQFHLLIESQVTEELILALFSQIGPVKGCKIIREPGSKSADHDALA